MDAALLLRIIVIIRIGIAKEFTQTFALLKISFNSLILNPEAIETIGPFAITTIG